MPSEDSRSSLPREQASGVHREIPLGVQLAGVAAFLLWRCFYFVTVVVIPALGWR